MNDKFELYKRHGVCEYLVWRVIDREIDWFVLREGQFEKLSPDDDGILRSTIFPGLWLVRPTLCLTMIRWPSWTSLIAAWNRPSMACSRTNCDGPKSN